MENNGNEAQIQSTFGALIWEHAATLLIIAFFGAGLLGGLGIWQMVPLEAGIFLALALTYFAAWLQRFFGIKAAIASIFSLIGTVFLSAIWGVLLLVPVSPDRIASLHDKAEQVPELASEILPAEVENIGLIGGQRMSIRLDKVIAQHELDTMLSGMTAMHDKDSVD